MPIPTDRGACIRHFLEKGKPRKQAIAICLDVERQRHRRTMDEATKRSGAFKEKK